MSCAARYERGEPGDNLEWRVGVRETERAEPSAGSRELIETFRRHLLDQGWHFGIGLTDLPIRAGRRPVAAHASATHGVGCVGPSPRRGATRAAPHERSGESHEGLLGESVGRHDGSDERRSARIATATSGR